MKNKCCTLFKQTFEFTCTFSPLDRVTLELQMLKSLYWVINCNIFSQTNFNNNNKQFADYGYSYGDRIKSILIFSTPQTVRHITHFPFPFHFNFHSHTHQLQFWVKYSDETFSLRYFLDPRLEIQNKRQNRINNICNIVNDLMICDYFRCSVRDDSASSEPSSSSIDSSQFLSVLSMHRSTVHWSIQCLLNRFWHVKVNVCTRCVVGWR